MPKDVTAYVAYDGPGVAEGSMDVRELAPALLAMGDLLQEANHTLNGDKATLAVHVQSDFRTGSFEINLGLQLLTISQISMYFGADTLKTAKHIAEYVGLVVGEKPSLITFLKWLSGRKPSSVTLELDIEGDENIVVRVDGDNNQITVNRNVYMLATEARVRKAVSDVVKPVRESGITSFEIRDESHMPVETVTKEELKAFVLPLSADAVQASDGSTTREQLVEVIKPSFRGDLRWVLSDGSDSRMGAIMKDAAFRERVEAGQRVFGKGDLLKVELRSTPHITSEGLRTEYEIIRVIDEFNAPRQLGGLLPPIEPRK